MIVIKNINNNVAHCYDSKGREVIAFGKGIGFYKPGEDIPLTSINRTFYNIKDTDYGVLRSIPTIVINTAIFLTDYASEELSVTFPSSMALVLADHLQFAITRKNQNIYLAQPIIQDLTQLYPDEMRVAVQCLSIIKKMTGETLPRPEAGTLALHFVNDRIQISNFDNLDNAKIIEVCTRIIEEQFAITIDRESFNYSRFASHLDYLIRRLINNDQIKSQNDAMYNEFAEKYPDTLKCVNMIDNYINEKIAIRMNKEELLYLVIHVNRLISRM